MSVVLNWARRDDGVSVCLMSDGQIMTSNDDVTWTVYPPPPTGMEPMNQNNDVLYLRPVTEADNDPGVIPTWIRQVHAMDHYWTSKFGNGPTAATYMLLSVSALGILYLLATPWFTLHAVYKALRA